MASKLPAANMKAVADWYLDQLGAEQHQQLLMAVKNASHESRPLRVGTMCSGTDSPVVVLHGLSAALGDALHVEHTFSCEFDPKKQQWIKDNFPSLKMLFGDINELKTGKATCCIAGQKVPVPAVDIVIAGFVCKSVSTENNERATYSNCIKDKSGKTGETFDGVMGYCKRYKPPVVICENVAGLVKWNQGMPPVINDVQSSFRKAGYAFEYKKLDTRSYLLPQRRNRVWMWAFLGRENDEAVVQTQEQVCAMANEEKGYSLDQLFKLAKVATTTKTALNPRQTDVVKSILENIPPSQRREDIVVDVAKSKERAPKCFDATSCIVPNSLPYRTLTKSILSPLQVCAVQGLFPQDFPAIGKYAKAKGNLCRDLSGNAFSTTVCMVVLISCLLHAPLGGAIPAPSTPPAKKTRAGAETPQKGKRARAEAVGETPRKRLKA